MIDWIAAEKTAPGAARLTESAKCWIETAAGRFRQERQREIDGDGMSFIDARDRANEIARAAKTLREALVAADAPSLIVAPDQGNLERLEAEATETAERLRHCTGRGSNAFSDDLKRGLVRVIAACWAEAGGTPTSSDLKKVAVEILRQADPRPPTRPTAWKYVERRLGEYASDEFEAKVSWSGLTAPNPLIKR